MNIQRSLEQSLTRWKKDPKRKPLLIRGARQVGKSHLISSFGKQFFDNMITIDFELEPEYIDCFQSLKPKQICNAISILKQQTITPGQTLLFLDEIQDCPNAIRALRYFKEKMPSLHVIGAGSLLELALKKAEFRMPVGRISYLYLYPVSFYEFLQTFNSEAVKALSQANINNPPAEAIHQHLIQQLKHYFIFGGLPEAMSCYSSSPDMTQVQAIQANIIETYQNDFGHYHSYASPTHLITCFKQAPMMIGQQIKYNKIDPETRSRELKKALEVLDAAAILHKVVATSAQGLSLEATTNEKKFKLNFIDIALVKRFNQLDAKLLLENEIMLINRGALTEQFVGQELLAYAPPYERPKLYFWTRDTHGTAEVDFVLVIDSQIYPVEVKAGKTGTLRSIQQFLKNHPVKFGIRISTLPLSFDGKILSIPLYMINEIPRLVRMINLSIPVVHRNAK